MMLRITINKNADGLVDYFTRSLSTDDYFFGDNNINGYWYGKLREELGLPKVVSKKSFSQIAHNINPTTGKQLTLRNDKNRRTSIEYLFSAPKSVSLFFALSDERTSKEILNQHRKAVRKVMHEIEQDMQTQTRINGRKAYVTTGNILMARFDHFLSRPTRDVNDHNGLIIPDMQLHSHVNVMNVTKHKNRYQAIEASTIHRTAKYYDRLYNSYLAHGLKNMGFDIRRKEGRFEIHSAGITQRTLEKFSRRTIEIEYETERRGITSSVQKGKLGAMTRQPKSNASKNVDLKKAWWSRLTLLEKQAIIKARDFDKTQTNKMMPERAIDLSLSHHLERNSTVATKIVLAKAMEFGYGVLNITDLKKELSSRQNLVYGRRGYVQYLTTKERIQEEDRMIAFASQTKATKVPLHSSYKIKQDFLSIEQQKAIHSILNSPNQVTILSGKAGVGKTTVLQEIHKAHKEKGRKIFAFAQSAVASRQVLVENGFGSADTVASLLKNINIQSRVKQQTILIDEAGLLSVKDTSQIFDIAHKQNARVLLVGDTAQHNSPVYGDALRLLMNKSKIEPAQITKIQRQKHHPAYKAVVKDLGEGKIKTGFEKLNKMGAIVEIEDVRDRHQKIAEDYIRSLEQKRTALVISPTHKEGEQLSEVIRQEMRNRGRLKGADRPFKIQTIVNLTKAEKSDSIQYEQGMIVQFVQNTKGFKAGQKYEVVKQEDQKVLLSKIGSRTPTVQLPKEQGERFQVFTPSTINLASGDLVRITHNGKSIDGKRIYNGQHYTIQGFTKDGSIKLNGGKILGKDFGLIKSGYVSTSFSAQGKTCDDVYIAQSSLSYGASNRKQFYVSASRAKHSIKIYTECKDELLKAIEKSADRLSARELAGKRKIEPIIQNRFYQRQLFYKKMINKLRENGRSNKKHQRQISREVKRCISPSKD